MHLAARCLLPPTQYLLARRPAMCSNFGEDSYSTSLVFWCRPTDKLSLNLNTDYFANFIKQNITIGDDSDTSFSGSGSSFATFAPYTSPWTYGGTAFEIGGGMHYQYSWQAKIHG